MPLAPPQTAARGAPPSAASIIVRPSSQRRPLGDAAEQRQFAGGLSSGGGHRRLRSVCERLVSFPRGLDILLVDFGRAGGGRRRLVHRLDLGSGGIVGAALHAEAAGRGAEALDGHDSRRVPGRHGARGGWRPGAPAARAKNADGNGRRRRGAAERRGGQRARAGSYQTTSSVRGRRRRDGLVSDGGSNAEAKLPEIRLPPRAPPRWAPPQKQRTPRS